MTATVALHEVSKRYERKTAVDRLSFSANPGVMFGLLGPNGAGKTSSIRMMTGITLPDEGRVELFGKPFTRESLKRVGYLPEERGLYRKMKVLEQLVFLGRLHGLSSFEAERRSRSWAERLQIAEALDGKTDELSKGMQQKIQFISTLLHEPELIIMDEPFSGLDPVNALLLEETLVELKKQGRTILFSTHRMDQVEKLCDSLVLVNGGKAVLQGTMREVKSRFGRDRLLVACEGDGVECLQRLAAFTGVKEFPEYTELRLPTGADAQAMLRELLAQGVVVLRWELAEPTLEEIFVRTVGGDRQ